MELPAGEVTPEWCAALASALDEASRRGADNLKEVLPCSVAVALLDRVQAVLHGEPTLLEVGGGWRSGAGTAQPRTLLQSRVIVFPLCCLMQQALSLCSAHCEARGAAVACAACPGHATLPRPLPHPPNRPSLLLSCPRRSWRRPPARVSTWWATPTASTMTFAACWRWWAAPPPTTSTSSTATLSTAAPGACGLWFGLPLCAAAAEMGAAMWVL